MHKVGGKKEDVIKGKEEDVKKRVKKGRCKKKGIEGIYRKKGQRRKM